MYFLLILIILMLAFPILARFVGWLLSAVFWLIVVVLAFAVVAAFVH